MKLFSLGSIAIFAACFQTPALAQDYRFAFNAGVSFKESQEDTRRRYSALLDALNRVSKQKFTFVSLYSDKVNEAVKENAYEFMLIHTHAAIKAEKEAGYSIVGLTDDRGDNSVHFLVANDSPARYLKDISAALIAAPGAQSWATATGRAYLRDEAQQSEPKFLTARYQDSIPIMIEVKAVPAGLTRSKKLADEFVQSGKGRVIYSTNPLPLYAVVARPDVPDQVLDNVRRAFTEIGESQTKVYSSAPFKGIRYSPDELKRLRVIYR